MAVTIDSDIEVPVWYADSVEAEDGDPIGFLHIPLGSDDFFITSRDSGYFEPILGAPPPAGWDDVSFLPPDGSPPNPTGYTNQSILGFYDTYGGPNNPLIGSVTPAKLATYLMHTANLPDSIGTTQCPFIEGTNPANGNTLFGNIDGVHSYVPLLVYACLYFSPNNDPIWGDIPIMPECIDAGVEYCFTSGTDVDVDDDLHIVFLSGPGMFTEVAGGPGGCRR